MNLVSIVSLIVLDAYVVIKAGDKKWKLINVGIIVASIVAGFVLAFLIGYLAGNHDFGTVEAFDLAVVSGYGGGACCAVGNYWRNGGSGGGRKRWDKSDRTVV
jgi:hypothetical protein